MSVVLILISRDMVLSINILLALGVVFFIIILGIIKVEEVPTYILFLIFVAANVIAFMHQVWIIAMLLFVFLLVHFTALSSSSGRI